MTPELWQALRMLVSSSLCLLLLACSGSAPSLEATSKSVATTPAVDLSGGDYRLGAGDKIRIIVFGEQDLSGEFVVGDSGKVDMPLIGGVSARGATVSEFQNRVVSQLRNGYLNDPKVSVEVLNYRPFFITGEVKSGGEYPYKAGLTVQDAVGVAGGYTYRAQTNVAYLRRAGEDKEIKVSLSSRMPINPGDSIRIPERFF
jgi:protein involved in polysaccharide export with SLBB domain